MLPDPLSQVLFLTPGFANLDEDGMVPEIGAARLGLGDWPEQGVNVDRHVDQSA
jgi:hypothetical protein